MDRRQRSPSRRHYGRGQKPTQNPSERRTAGDAKLVEAEIRSAIKDKKDQTFLTKDPPLTEVIALYMKHAQTLRGHKEASHHAMRFGLWADKYKASETRKAAAHFIADAREKCAASTINWSLSTLKKGLEIAYDLDLVPENYGDRVKTLPVNNIRDQTLSMDQLHTLLEFCSTDLKAAIWIALYTACRRGEIVSMTRQSIGLNTITVYAGNTKTQKTRTIPIIQPLRPWLEHIPLLKTHTNLFKMTQKGISGN